MFPRSALEQGVNRKLRLQAHDNHGHGIGLFVEKWIFSAKSTTFGATETFSFRSFRAIIDGLSIHLYDHFLVTIQPS
jgi:hypothetical protein